MAVVCPPDSFSGRFFEFGLVSMPLLLKHGGRGGTQVWSIREIPVDSDCRHGHPLLLLDDGNSLLIHGSSSLCSCVVM